MKQDASLIAHYHHPDFILETNGQKQDYDASAEGHRKVYAAEDTNEIRYDDGTWAESPERIATRVWIKTRRPNEAPPEFEVALIASYVDRKIHRVWELT
ncbi:hypothetical protein [Paraburkholderia sp. BL18I3N2]|uniref:hypothetical protein n=1 Tax=Paraburkholderia sp. BL18I3N2 TaxID=1938799 RepID=UPI001C62C805|nr:hypothetical protein [Paraburkholderia sp. BL18I3N2]